MIIGAYDMDVGNLYEVHDIKKDEIFKGILTSIEIDSCSFNMSFIELDGKFRKLDIRTNVAIPISYSRISQMDFIKIINVIMEKVAYLDGIFLKIYQHLVGRIISRYLIDNNFDCEGGES